MLCPKCGAELPKGALFCDQCGTKLKPEPVHKKKKSSSKPKKRSKKKQKGMEPPPLPMRIILVLCALILICVNLGNLFVGFIGKNAEATILSTHLYQRLPEEEYLYSWDVTYEFYANGKKYVDTDQLVGSQGNIDTAGYHVSYLSFAPAVSRLTRKTSVAGAKNLGDMLGQGFVSVIAFLLQMLVAYFLLWVAFPKLPFFGLGKK